MIQIYTTKTIMENTNIFETTKHSSNTSYVRETQKKTYGKILH